MSGGDEKPEDYDALQREVVTLRLWVAELQRAAARHEDTEGISLAEREELLRDAERVAHLGTWTWDLGSGRVTWSDELFRILGLEPGSITPSVDAFFSRVHPDDRARAQNTTSQAIEDGVMPLVDCRIVRPDGSIRHVSSSNSMLFDEHGVTRRVVGGMLDRTDNLAVETKLRRTLALLEEAQRFAQLGSWRYDPSSDELEWSREFCRIAGLPPNVKPAVERFLERVVPEDRDRFRARHERNAQLAKGGEIEGRLQRPDGEVRHVKLRAFPVVGDDGQPELRGTMLDVTDQVRMREELSHAQQMEAVGRLAGGIAHDFNNLLTVISGNLDLLAARVGPAPELDNSLQALSSAASLTRRLLTFGRKAQLSLKLLSPNDLVRATTALMHRLVGDEVRLEIDLAEDMPGVLADPVEIERALVNLVVNARDAMPEGGGVRIGTRVRKRDKGVDVELSVADEGPGIDEADRKHIFEPFFSTRSQAGGTGLGLATVLGTAEQHGGTVRVEARKSGGTVFTIVLPAAESADPLELADAGTRPVVPEVAALRLLVIDDEPKVAEVTRRILETQGHAVHVTSRPDEALAIWAEHGATIDLVICDVVMAQMRGPELVERLAAMGTPPRVLFITGYSEEAVHSELGYPVLGKPFKAAALWRAIHEALS